MKSNTFLSHAPNTTGVDFTVSSKVRKDEQIILFKKRK
jgi:hypothetical protein